MLVGRGRLDPQKGENSIDVNSIVIVDSFGGIHAAKFVRSARDPLMDRLGPSQRYSCDLL